MVRPSRGVSMMVRPSRGVSMMVRLSWGVYLKLSNQFYRIPINKIIPLHIISLHKVKHLTIHGSNSVSKLQNSTLAAFVYIYIQHTYMTWHTRYWFVGLMNIQLQLWSWSVLHLSQLSSSSLEMSWSRIQRTALCRHSCTYTYNTHNMTWHTVEY